MRTDVDRLDQHSAAAGGRPVAATLHAWCEVCRTFDTDPSGRCPACDPSPTGDLVGDLIAQRSASTPRPVTDDRLHAAGLLSADEA